MKIIQTFLLAVFAMSASAAPERGLKSKKKSFAFSSSDNNPTLKADIGCRKECSDKRFTMVCQWEAEKKTKKSHSHKKSRRLGNQESALDYDEETEDKAPADRQLTTVDVGGGRRLKVSLSGVECILGVGKKDSDDSSEDYEEYKERLKFPSDDWMLKIKAGEDALGDLADYYKFTRVVEFEGVEDPNNSADELTIKGTLELEILCLEDADGFEFLAVDDMDLKFDC